jgi:hypothetical protein
MMVIARFLRAVAGAKHSLAAVGKATDPADGLQAEQVIFRVRRRAASA